LNILLINSSDRGGGGARIADDCLSQFVAADHQAWLAVGSRGTDSERVMALAGYEYRSWWEVLCAGFARPVQKMCGAKSVIGRASGSLSRRLAHPGRAIRGWLGHEDFDFPSSRSVQKFISDKAIDLIHCHNLHGGFFDLRVLPELSRRVPVVLTMHDAWLLSGHCVHSLQCERWKTGCGKCPDLTIYPAVRRDATAYNWRRKRAIYDASRLHIATPSHWLMEKARESILAPAIVDAKVIPNGIDLSVFSPSDQHSARHRLELPQNRKIVLFVSDGIRRNMFKDFGTLRAALERVSENFLDRKLLFVGLGESDQGEACTSYDARFVPFEFDRTRTADYYRAADVFVHAAKVDTFPTTVLEALACGTPTIASAVGGVPEQIRDGETGYLVPMGDVEAMAHRIGQVLNDESLRNAMRRAGPIQARRAFDVRKMAADYLAWFHEIVAQERNTNRNGIRGL
jgi:glycosyltransferase involved in cell wall biosynthesis